jgi:phosphoserine aminotransferase
MGLHSFASGQSPLPPDVLAAIRDDIADWQQSGQSLLELPFTSGAADRILRETEAGLRRLLRVPANYSILFLQGGASAQFAVLPLNLANRHVKASYVLSGHWSRRAVAEASHWIPVHIAAKGDGTSLPDPEAWVLQQDADYCHYTSNESADGLQFHTVPETGAVPLIADMTADLFTRPVPVNRFGVLYASCQKNLGVSGLTVVIVRDDLLHSAHPGVPAPFDYTRQARERSKVNTPPVFAVAVAGRMARWLIDKGGLDAAEKRSRQKSSRLYSLIGSGEFYHSPVAVPDRSHVSVRFHLPSAELESMFVAEAGQSGLIHLGGHPEIGGLRASLYNPVMEHSVEVLAEFMRDFEARRG